MFKLESYITPVLLNYVGKYVKNFKPEQSQVSLWDGDATFQNLDLELNVLNEQINFPFTFISGHIHELLIHVPWVKITSEPIVITINTIECILKMKDNSDIDNENSLQQKSNFDSLQEETPSGYIKSIVTKVVNNIEINCNNLILKFVEEDIVLSVNIRFLGFQNVNNLWQPAFTDINIRDMILRKLITMKDLTLCLDRMDASGKIEIYQDPVVYRCSMVIRWLINYSKYESSQNQRESVSRFDIHFNKIEFSVTEQQIPMILRLVTLFMNSQSQLYSGGGSTSTHSEKTDAIAKITDETLTVTSSSSKTNISNNNSNNNNTNNNNNNNNNVNWSSWAWNTLSSFVPDWSSDWSPEKSLDDVIQVMDFGIYIDDAIITFKITEINRELLSHKNVKVKYRPFVTLQLSGVIGTVLIHGSNFTGIQIGLGYIKVYPQGNCTCGFYEVNSSNMQGFDFYLSAGVFNSKYYNGSLFDLEAIENRGLTKDYIKITKSRVYSAEIFDELSNRLLAFVLDYNHLIEMPEELIESELESKSYENLEFNNFVENTITKYHIGNLEIKITSGLLHRISTIISLIKNDFLAFFNNDINETVFESLRAVTIEEYDALSNYIPIKNVNGKIKKLNLQFILADHYQDSQKMFVDNTKNIVKKVHDHPRLSIEIDSIELKIKMPIYPFRLVSCASQQTETPISMLNSCYKQYNLKMLNVTSRLNLMDDCQMLFITPFDCQLSSRQLILPQYWTKLNLIHSSYNFQIDNIIITTTKVKLLIINYILNSIFSPTNINTSIIPTIISDACHENNPIFLELIIENINYLSNKYLKYTLMKSSVNSIRIFALDNNDQAFIMSGSNNDNPRILNLVAQYPNNFNSETDHLIFLLQFSKIKIILDPLLFDWLKYDCNPNKIQLFNSSRLRSEKQAIDETSSDNSTRKKFPSLHENVHSPSDGDKKINLFNWNNAGKNQNFTKKLTCEKSNMTSIKITNFILNQYPKWKKLIFNITFDNCVIYQPTISINSIGVDSIDEAIEHALNMQNLLKMFVMQNSKFHVKSASWDNKYFLLLDSIDLINIDNVNIKNFPWTLDFDKFFCYSVINRNKDSFLDIKCSNVTVDVTLKPNISLNNDNNCSTLGFCIYIHTEPIKISITTEQLQLIDYLLTNNRIIFHLFSSNKKNSQSLYTKLIHNDNLKFPFQLPLSPTQLFFTETQTTSTSASISRKESEIETDNTGGITAWIQWTITKIIIEFSTESHLDCDNRNKNEIFQNINYKIVVELEDIITSIDWQLIYMKFKNKITAAKITHYEKLKSYNSYDNNWKLGSYTGLIMSSKNEDLNSKNEVDFLNLTITKAKSNNVYNKWMKFNNSKFSKTYMFNDNNDLLMTNYIIEIVVEMQMIEIIFPVNLIDKFEKLLKVFFKYSESNESQKIIAHKQFPLIYVDFKGLNLIIPIDSLTIKRYDMLVLKTDSILIIPHAENPICRTILNSDIYELAAQSNILYTPGSILEDRQYQIKVNNIYISCANWETYDIKLSKRKTQQLHTMNENPALEWNKIENDSSNEKLFISCLINKLNISCIFAPPMILTSDVIVCGNAIEITFLTDIEVYLSLEQIQLLIEFTYRLKILSLIIFDEKPTESSTAVIGSTNISIIRKSRIESIQEFREEIPKDSGIDVDTSSLDGGICLDSIMPNYNTIIPYEYVINCGKISLFIYEFKNESNDGNIDTSNSKLPLFYVEINQPNGYISQKHLVYTVRINCFDVLIRINKENNIITDIPNVRDYLEILLETKNGDPDSNTGIPPSFFIIKFEKNIGNYKVFLEMGRPTKINLSESIFFRINVIKNKLVKMIQIIIEKFENENKLSDNTTCPQSIFVQNNKIDTMNIILKTKQIVLAYKFNDITEIINSLSESFITVVNKPRKIHGIIDLVSFMITSTINYNTKIFLNPFSCKFISNISWESWQNINTNPLIQIQSYADSMNFELSPEQLKILENIFINVKNYCNQFNVEDIPEIDVQKLLSTEQHYQDDLKAGAFQFADGTNDQFPLPYQVLFSNFPHVIMAWKYPQPRVLTRLNLTDVLWEITDPEIINLNKITCVIEYWNDSLMTYQHFIDFKISEFDNFLLLPNKLPTRAVSCTWRAIIYSIDRESTTLTARDLVECLRIDSYFNALLIPSIEITLNFNYIKLSIFNNFCHDNYKNLPYPLNNYKLNNLIPPNQCFATITFCNNLLFYNKWTNGAIMTDYSSTLNIQILDYESIMMQSLLEPFTFNFQICQLNSTKILLMTKELTFKFNAEIAHSLTLSLNSWYTILQNNHNHIIYNGIIIANDCNIPIRFTQDKTTDDFILQSRECYFYSWRRKSHSKLRIAIKIDNHWIWSDLFTLYYKNNVIDINNNNGCIQKIFYKIKSITSTQKIIFFGGQLIIRNELNDNLELKLIKYNSVSNNKTVLSEQIFFIAKHSTLPSLVVNNTDTVAIKLKYSHFKSSISWTGDIPLLFNSNFHQPWLVKLPTDKNNQFFSIWVRVITENLSFGCKTLVLLTPLFLIQSWLPSSLIIHMKTLSLNTSNILTINEYGKKYQVYCAGTTEHCHELNIQFNDGKMLDYSIPMSYNIVDQQNYFKRPKSENIDIILDQLDNNNYENKLNPIWPFECNKNNYILVESQTDINVKYKDSGLISSTLLVELRPWCYIFNYYGKMIKLISSNTNFSHSIPNNGVISPPKIIEIFYIEIELFDNTFISSPLQFVNSELKREFSMPQINGMIPLDGSIKIPIDCQSVTAILIISSQIVDDIRVIKISSSHVVCNLTNYNLKVSPIYVNNNNNYSDNDWPLKCEKFHFNLISNDNNNSGTSIDYWINLDSKNNDQNYSNLYFTLRLNNFNSDIHDWSCPIDVNQSTERYCITIQDDNSTLPIVITVQKDTYIFYITIHYDNHPQFTIKNSCQFPFLIGQPNLSFDLIEPDSKLFSWICKIKTHHTCNYTLKNFGSRMPDNIINKEIIPRLMFCVPLCLKQTNDELKNTIDKFNLKLFESKSNTIWKTVIEFPTIFPIKFDRYIKIDFYGDIKVMVESFGHTICIYLEPKSEIEVSIRDVRNRLMNENTKLYDQKTVNDHVKSMITIKSNQSSMENTQADNILNFYTEDNNIMTNKYCNIISNSSDNIILTIYFQGINIIITKDDEHGIKNEIAVLYLIHTFIEITSSAKYFNIKTFIADLQLDNQLFEKGGYDFSVVLKSQNPLVINNNTIINSLLTLKSITAEVKKNSLLIIECSLDKINNTTAFKSTYIRILPINIYIEDKFITQLLDYATTLIRPFSTICFDSFNSLKLKINSMDREVTNIYVPENILINARVISSPLRLQNLKIDPISILLSIHTSARLYVALDHSPLQFGTFDRQNVFTTPYKLGNDITMHYLSGAIFGAGWVVGSLEILGSPGSFAQALSSGLKDFISLPFQGLLQGPWGFIIGITHGSASLMKHITAGTVNSVTKLASSVARNLDRLTLDDEHLQRQEEARRLRPQSMTQGLYRGLTGFGISLLAAVAGLAHHPLQNFWSQGPSTRGIVTGVGLGLVGVVTKPLSGAAELVALTGQGLLQHTGWNSMPLIRRKPNMSLNYIENSKYRYSWKLMDYLDKNYDTIVYSVDAEMIIGNKNLNEKLSVVLVITKKKLIIIDTNRDNVEKMISLSEFSCVDENSNDPKLLRLIFLMNNTNKPKNHFDTSEIQEMDTEMRARVEQYVLNTGFNIHLNESSSNDVLAQLVSSNYDENSLLFLFECYTKVCFINIIKIIKRQMSGIDFTVL